MATKTNVASPENTRAAMHAFSLKVAAWMMDNPERANEMLRAIDYRRVLLGEVDAHEAAGRLLGLLEAEGVA